MTEPSASRHPQLVLPELTRISDCSSSEIRSTTPANGDVSAPFLSLGHINLARQSCYSLREEGRIGDHEAQIASVGYTLNKVDMIPVREIAPIAGARYDFRNQRKLGDADPGLLGTDINVVLENSNCPAAMLSGSNGFRLRIWTEQPGLQIYTGKHLPSYTFPNGDCSHKPFSGISPEVQNFPDSLNNPKFPSITCTLDEPYDQKLAVEIAMGGK